MKKKILLLLLSCTLIFTLAACGDNKEKQKGTETENTQVYEETENSENSDENISTDDTETSTDIEIDSEISSELEAQDDVIYDAIENDSTVVFGTCIEVIELKDDEIDFYSDYITDADGNEKAVKIVYTYAFEDGEELTEIQDYYDPAFPYRVYPLVFEDSDGNLYCAVTGTMDENTYDCEYTVLDMDTFNDVAAVVEGDVEIELDDVSTETSNE